MHQIQILLFFFLLKFQTQFFPFHFHSNKNFLFSKLLFSIHFLKIGSQSFEETSEFIKDRFMQLKSTPQEDQPIYIHITCAINTDNIQKVFFAVKSILLSGVFNQIIWSTFQISLFFFFGIFGFLLYIFYKGYIVIFSCFFFLCKNHCWFGMNPFPNILKKKKNENKKIICIKLFYFI